MNPGEGDTRQGMISWEAARRVAAGVTSRRQLGAPDRAELRDDFAELVPLAESLVTEQCGLRPAAGPAHAVVVDRSEWIAANTHSFERLLTPLLARLPSSPAAGLPGYGAVARVGKAVTGAEMGALLGWMAGRVLGQYDVILGAVEEGVSGDVLFVGPNIVDIERRYGFPRRQFRLWIALHELTHRAQFTGVEWMRSHFMSLIEEAFGSSMPAAGQILDGLRKAVQATRSRRNPIDSGIGLLGLFMDDAQREVFFRVQGLMSLLEGHGDVVMDRAGADRIPLAGHFSRVLADRRKSMSGVGKLVMQMVGLDAKMRQYAEGERFVHEVETRGGRELFDRVWERPENLPDSSEIREPDRWVARVG